MTLGTRTSDTIATVDVSGPLVGPKKPSAIMLENIERAMQDVADFGAGIATRGFLSGAGGRQPISAIGDRVGDHVVGRVFARPSKGGRRWHTAGVVQVYNEGLSARQGVSLMAAASILEGRLNVMRNVTRQMASRLRKIDLTKGLGG